MYTWILYFRWYPSLSITIKGSPERKNTLSWMMKLPMEASWKSLKLLIKYCTSKHHCVKHVSKGYLIATMRPSIFPDCFVNWRSKATKLDIITLSVGKSRTKHQKRRNLNEVKKNCKKFAKLIYSADLHYAQNNHKFGMQQSSHGKATHLTSPSEVDREPVHKKLNGLSCNLFFIRLLS